MLKHSHGGSTGGQALYYKASFFPLARRCEHRAPNWCAFGTRKSLVFHKVKASHCFPTSARSCLLPAMQGFDHRPLSRCAPNLSLDGDIETRRSGTLVTFRSFRGYDSGAWRADTGLDPVSSVVACVTPAG